jgi:histidine triad (HIT) family protein
MDTVFNKILNKEIPAEVLYEDEDVLVFMDITPASIGHALAIPKKAEGNNLYDVSAEVMAPVWRVANELGPKIADAVGATGFTVVMNNNEASGQTVFYPHVHMIPRHDADGLRAWPKLDRSFEEIGSDAKKIRSILNE